MKTVLLTCTVMCCFVYVSEKKDILALDNMSYTKKLLSSSFFFFFLMYILCIHNHS